MRSTQYLHLLACPGCHGRLAPAAKSLVCGHCAREFPEEDGIPRLYVSQPAADSAGRVTGIIRRFYETHPFPDYEAFDDLAGLIEKARQGVFARLLDEQIPFSTRILDCGCGTGQLANFLGIAHRTVFGSDLSLASLRLAESFRRRHELERVFFLQMNLFEPAFSSDTFDVIICNGVLHHTLSPRKGFAGLVRLLRPGGFLVVGLYHRFGRLATDLRRVLFHLAGPRLAFLDPRLRREPLGKERRQAWFADQYQNPHESKHTISELLKWVQEENLTFVKSIPKTRMLNEFTSREPLFEPEPPGNVLERSLIELGMTFGGGREGGFFTVIARKSA